jgi:large subunit ribosomal protein L18
MKKKIVDISNRLERHARIRRTISGTPERPRLCVFRSLKHLEAQLIDDSKQQTVLSLSTRDKGFVTKSKAKGNVKTALELGQAFATKAKKDGFSKVVFDRGGYQYHGRVKAFADAAREAGLQF